MNFSALCSLPFSHSTTVAAPTAWPAPGRRLCVGSHELAVSLRAEHCLLLHPHGPMPGTYCRCSANVCCLFTVEIYFKVHLYKCRGDKREGVLPRVWGNKTEVSFEQAQRQKRSMEYKFLGRGPSTYKGTSSFVCHFRSFCHQRCN